MPMQQNCLLYPINRKPNIMVRGIELMVMSFIQKDFSQFLDQIGIVQVRILLAILIGEIGMVPTIPNRVTMMGIR